MIGDARGGLRNREGGGDVKRAFLICPVRGHDPEETKGIVKQLESEGWAVHWPPRDTLQNDPLGGIQTCTENRGQLRTPTAYSLCGTRTAEAVTSI